MPVSVAVAYARYDEALAALREAGVVLREAIAAEAGALGRAMPGDVEGVIETVAGHYHISRVEIVSRIRTAEYSEPRQVAMYLARLLTPHGVAMLGRLFARDHGTILYAVNAITARMQTEPEFTALVERLKAIAATRIAA